MTDSYQTYNKASTHADEIYQLKKHKEKVARMKAEGTYCDPREPDMSYLNYKMQSCLRCPHYEECKDESERKSMSILKYRSKKFKKSKAKRKKK